MRSLSFVQNYFYRRYISNCEEIKIFPVQFKKVKKYVQKKLHYTTCVQWQVNTELYIPTAINYPH